MDVLQASNFFGADGRCLTLWVIKMRSASRMKRLGAAAVLQELPFN